MDTDEPSSGDFAPRKRPVGSSPTWRLTNANEREAALDECEIRAAAHEAGIGARTDEAEVVLADAATRDDLADQRDAVADARELAAALDAFLHPDADQYSAAIKARRAAAIDRSEAQSDRLSSADDRTRLSDG